MPTAPSVIARTVAVAGPGAGNTDRLVVQMRDELLMYGPNINPLAVLSMKAKKRSVGGPEFKVMNDKQLPRFDAVNDVSPPNTTDTTITVDHGEYFRVHDDILNTRTGEHMLVTGVSGDDLTVVRNYQTGGTPGTGVAMLDNDEIMICGNNLSERASPASTLVTDPTTITNYIQRFGRTTSVSWQRRQTEEYGPAEKERQKKAATIEMKKDLELAFKFGKPLRDVEGSSPRDSAVQDSRHKTGGLQYFIDTYASANAHDAGGAISQNQLWDWIQPLFEDMPEDTTDQQMELAALCSPKAFRVFHSWGIPAVEISPSTKEFGLQLRTYLTPVGRLTLIQDYTLKGTEYGDWMFIVNVKDLEYVYQNGLDIQLQTDVQTPGVHEDKDELFGYVGFGIQRPELHGYIKNMALAA